MKLFLKTILSLLLLGSTLLVSTSGVLSGCIIGGGILCPSATPPSSPITIFITSGTSWNVPADWNNSNNTIEVIGAGGGAGGGGGGGSAAGGVRGPGGAGAQGIIIITYTP